MAKRMSANAKPASLPASNFAGETFLPRRLPSWFVASRRTARRAVVVEVVGVVSDIEADLPGGGGHDGQLREGAADLHAGGEGVEEVVGAAEDPGEEVRRSGDPVLGRARADLSVLAPVGTDGLDDQD